MQQPTRDCATVDVSSGVILATGSPEHCSNHVRATHHTVLDCAVCDKPCDGSICARFARR